MLTKFGKALRGIRIERDELLRDMAGKLGVTVAYLSAVENGKRKIPDEWVPKITSIYGLNDAEVRRLQELAYEDRNDIKLDLSGATSGQRELAYSFARRFQNLNSDDVKKMKKLLNKRRSQ